MDNASGGAAPSRPEAGVPGQSADLLVRHAHIITMDDDARIVADGAIAVVGRTIVDVGEDAVLAQRYEPDRIVDAGGAPVHPGLVEAHLHATYLLYRGALPDHILEDEVFDAFQRIYLNGVTAEEEYLGVALAAMEMLRNGTTCFLEAGTIFEPSAAARAAQRVGIRAVLGDAFIWDQPRGFAQGKETPESGPVRVRGAVDRAPKSLAEALDRLGQQLGRNADPDALVTGHVALLGLGTASEALLLEAKRRADEAGVVVNMHHAYSPADTAADRLRYGKDPLVHLAEIGFLDRNVTLGHANHLTDEECEVLLDRGASIAWAPAASMLWGHGGSSHGRQAELWRRGANISLGSDSGNWSNDYDLFKQASLALLTSRQDHADRGYLLAEDVLRMATRGGARAAGLEDRIGSIEVGKRADLVIHTLGRPELIPVTDMTRNLIYAARSKSVHTVIVDGAVVLDHGSFVGVDEGALLAEVNQAVQAMLGRLGLAAEPNRVARRQRSGSRG